VNELAMDFPSSRVDDGYLKVLIVAQAVVTEMLRKLFAVCDSLKIAVEVHPDPVSERDAIFHIKKILSHCRTSNRFSLDDHERDATIGKGLPRFRALARTTATDRFSEKAMQAGDEPSSISAIKCAVWAAVHFLLPMRTMEINPACQHSFRNEMGYGTSEPCGVCVRSHFEATPAGAGSAQIRVHFSRTGRRPRLPVF
jgi:hypothetical protein